MIGQPTKYLHGHWSIVIVSMLILLIGAALLAANSSWRQRIGSDIANYVPPAFHRVMSAAHKIEMMHTAIGLLHDSKKHIRP
jgi:hypothetical protein